MKIVKALPFLAMGTMALGLVGVTVLAPVANAETQASTVTQTVKMVVAPEIGVDLDKTFGEGTTDHGKFKNDATGNTDDKHDTAQGNGVDKIQYQGNVPGRITLTDEDDDTDLKNAADPTAAGIPTVADTATAAKGWNALVKVTKAGQTTEKTFAMPKKSGTPIVLVEAEKEDLKTLDRAKAETKFNFKKDATVAPGTYTDVVVYTVAADDTATTPVTNPQH